jgi:hypothetical protein
MSRSIKEPDYAQCSILLFYVNLQAWGLGLNGYEGRNCEIESSSVKLVKSVQWTTTIISILFLAVFWVVIMSNDLLSYFM